MVFIFIIWRKNTNGLVSLLSQYLIRRTKRGKIFLNCINNSNNFINSDKICFVGNTRFYIDTITIINSSSSSRHSFIYIFKLFGLSSRLTGNKSPQISSQSSTHTIANKILIFLGYQDAFPNGSDSNFHISYLSQLPSKVWVHIFLIPYLISLSMSLCDFLSTPMT